MALTPLDKQRLQERVAPLTQRNDRVGEAARIMNAQMAGGAPNAGLSALSGASQSGLAGITQTAPNAFAGGRTTQADVSALGDIGQPGGTLSFVGVSPDEQRRRSELAASINLEADALRASNLGRSRRASDREQASALQQSVDQRRGLQAAGETARMDAALAAEQGQLDREARQQAAETRAAATLGAAQTAAESRERVAQGLQQARATTQQQEEQRLAARDEQEKLQLTRAGMDTLGMLNTLRGLNERTGIVRGALGEMAAANPLARLTFGATEGGSQILNDRAEYNSVANQLVIGLADQLPGVLSDRDVQLLIDTTANFGNDPQANAAIIENTAQKIMRGLENRGITLDPQSRATAAGITSDEINALAAENNMTPEEILAELEREGAF